MLTTAKLIEAAKAKHGMPSNYRLARVLGISDNTMVNWAKGHTYPDDINTIRLAALGGFDPAEALAAVAAERAGSNAETRKVWETVAKRSRAAVAAFMAVILSMFIGGGPDGGAYASEVNRPALHASTGDRLCIMSTALRALLQRSKAWLDTIAWAIFGPLVPSLRFA